MSNYIYVLYHTARPIIVTHDMERSPFYRSTYLKSDIQIYHDLNHTYPGVIPRFRNGLKRKAPGTLFFPYNSRDELLADWGAVLLTSSRKEFVVLRLRRDELPGLRLSRLPRDADLAGTIAFTSVRRNRTFVY